MQNKDSISVFWILVLFIWLASTIVDRIWWNCFSSIPSWDQADYLNSAIEHARALSLLDGFGISDLTDNNIYQFLNNLYYNDSKSYLETQKSINNFYKTNYIAENIAKYFLTVMKML